MTRRNFILLIIVLAAVLLFSYLVLFFRQPGSPGDGSTTGGTNFFAAFNPWGKSSEPSPQPPSEGEPTTPETPTNPGAPEEIKLKKVSTVPVAGYLAYKKERYKEVPPPPPPVEGEVPQKNTKVAPPEIELATALRYVDRTTGNVFQTFADKIEEVKFSTTTIPKIYEAFFGKSTNVVLRYLKGNQIIQTYVGTLPKEVLGGDTTVANELKGYFLAENITEVSVSPDAQKIFYLLNMGDGVVGTVVNLVDAKKTQVFSSAFTEWLTQWPTPNTITFTTRPDSSVQGFIYAFNLTTKSFTRVLGEVNGLTTLTSPSGKMVLSGDNFLTLSLYHTDTKTTEAVGVKTLPEKCVWESGNVFIYCAVPKIGGRGDYPESWYKGLVSFSDQIWRVNTETGNATVLIDPALVPGGEEIDGIKLSLAPDGRYLFFVNKKNSSLWELDLK